MAGAWITAADLELSADPRAVEAAEAASNILYNLSGQRYPGIQTTTEVYVASATSCWFGCDILHNYGIDPLSVRWRPHSHFYMAEHEQRQLRLRQKPVTDVSSVTLSGGATFTDYSVVNNAYIVRNDQAAWQLLNGIQVTYTYGSLPPAMARSAAIKLGNGLIKSYTSGECDLPERVTSITRQGLSFALLDPQTFLDHGRTGIYEVDIFLAAANPAGAVKRARVFSPDQPRGERRR